MNPIMLKLWIDAKRTHLQHCQNIGVMYSREEANAMLNILDELEDDFNLEQYQEEDHYIEKNF